MAEGQVIGCHSVEEWKGHLEREKDSQKLVVVDFTASWCGPCRMIAPILDKLAKELTHVLFLKVDVDELQSVAAEWEVDAMPTLIFLREGKTLEKIVGARNEQGLRTAILKFATMPA